MSLSQEKSEISDKILLKLFNKYGIKKVIDTAITKILESKNDNLSQIINTLLNNIGSENLLQKILLLAKNKNIVLNENNNNTSNLDYNINNINEKGDDDVLQKKRQREEMNENNIDIQAIINNIKNISNNNNNNNNNNNKNEDTESFNEESVSSISNKQKNKLKKTHSSSNINNSYYENDNENEDEENESESDSNITETNNNNNNTSNNKKISDFTEDSIRKYKYMSRMHKVENIKLLEKYERVGKGGFLIPTGENKERYVYAISGLPSKKNIYFRCSDRTCHAKGKIEINEEHSFILTKQHEKPLQQHSYYVKLNNH